MLRTAQHATTGSKPASPMIRHSDWELITSPRMVSAISDAAVQKIGRS